MIVAPVLPPIVSTPLVDPFAGRLIVQIYRGGYGGRDTSSQLQRDLDIAKRYNLTDICFHGFPEEMVGAWLRLSKYAKDRELRALASWGLDGTRANDGTTLTSQEKGECVGHVLALSSCVAGLLDAEGRWDKGGSDPQGPTEQGAIEMGLKIRTFAPNALVGDQPWPWIEMHGDLRRSARPFGQGGTFAGFPVDEFAYITNWGRFRQNYYENWDEKGAYAKVTNRMEKEWAPVQNSLHSFGLDRPLRVTLQAYSHEKTPWNFVHALLRWLVRDQQAVVLWSDPFPTPYTLRLIAAVQRLVKEKFAGPGIDPNQAVLAWQRAYNQRAPENKKIDADGWFGNESLLALEGI